MSLRLVRCPFCGKRFNVTGIAAGSRLRCGGCTAVLTVPSSDAPHRTSFRLSRSLVLQVTGGIAAGLLVAFATFHLLRASPGSTAPVVSAIPRPPAVPGGDATPPGGNPGGIDDPFARAIDGINKEFGIRFVFRRESSPYLIALEPSERFHASLLMEEYAQRLQSVLASFRREFSEPLGLPAVQPALPVIVFNSRESFDRYFLERDRRKMAESIKGIYEYERQRIVVYQDANVPIEVLLHEGAHQLVDYYTNLRKIVNPHPPSYWFQEGIGTYFEGFRRTGGELLFDPAVSHGRLPTLKQVLREEDAKDFIPVNVLVQMTVNEFWSWFQAGQLNEPDATTRRAQVYYAESWAFVHFLRQSGGNARKVLDEYLRLETAGRGGKQAFEDLVRQHLEMELSQLQEKFITYIKGLR